MSDERDSPGTDAPGRFDGACIDRRTFVRLSATAGAALALPGNATASVTHDAFDAEYEYVVNHTPADHAVPTLVRFGDSSGPAAMESAVDGEVVTTTTPEPAAHAQLTAAEAATVAELPTAQTLTYAPGANPFWRLGYYPLGVFPDPTRCLDYIVYEEMVAGLEHIREQNSDRMRMYSVGKSPGHPNNVTGREDPKEVWGVEVTNDIDDEASYEAKEKVLFSLSIHGDERAGAEAGCRFIENLFEGREREIEALLDDVVLLFVFANPDGWVARHPQYEGRFSRQNSEDVDLNRQFPQVGWVDPTHFPAEPRGANGEDDDPGIDQDVPRDILQTVPDVLSIVEHYRDYENLNYAADFHGKSVFPGNFVLGLISQDQFDHRALHELYDLNAIVDEDLTGRLDPRPYNQSVYDYSTIWDTLGYTVSGAFGDWLAYPESLGGLGTTSMDFEMAFANFVANNYYDPNLVDKQVTGYVQGIRSLTEIAVTNSDTPNTDDQFASAVETGGLETAYVTTDALTRSSDQLVFPEEDAEPQTVQNHDFSGVLGPGADGSGFVSGTDFSMRREHEFTVPEAATRVEATCSWGANTQDVDFFLEDADGNPVASSTNFGGPESFATSIEGGETYTYVVKTFASAAVNYTIDGEATAPTGGGSGGGGETSVARESETLSLSGGAVTGVEVPEGTHTLSVSLDPDGPASAALRDPAGETVRSREVSEESTMVDGPGAAWTVRAPDAGRWTVVATPETVTADAIDAAATGETVTVRTATVQAANAQVSPDPEEVIGFEQFDYKVSPFVFFDAKFIPDDDPLRALEVERDFDEFADGPVDPLSVDAVAENGVPDNYDNLVVIHDDGITRQDYVDALDAFVERGGNLVLTDAGTKLAGAMSADLTSGIGAGDISEGRFYVAHLGEKQSDQPLLEDARPIQNQLWKIAGLGYSTGTEAPMTLIDQTAFEDAGGITAGVQGNRVSAGTLVGDGTDSSSPTTRELAASDAGSVHFIGGLFPPASQGNLHPLGLLDYSTSFLGHLMLTNALGFVQTRTTAGETDTFGGEATFDLGNVGGGLTAGGTRSDDGSVFTGGQTNEVTVTVTSLSEGATVYDRIPDGWTVDPDFGDVTRVEGNQVYFGEVPAVGEKDDPVELTYFAEAPSGAGETGRDTFGPAVATTGSSLVEFAGTDTNTVVGPSQ